MYDMTIKQQRFAQVYIELGIASEAYKRVYDCHTASANTINRKAYALLQHPKVNAMIEKLQTETRQRHQITVDDILQELEEARQTAKTQGSPSAMVSATMGKAKILGLDKVGVGVIENPMAALIAKLQGTSVKVVQHISDIDDDD